MFSVDQLCTISSKVNFTDITLKLISEFYISHLCNKSFVYHIDNVSDSILKLRFKKEDLCHLLGIHGIVENLKNKKDYTGLPGFNKLNSGEVDFDFLKRTNRPEFKNYRDRILYFPFIYQLVHNPTIILFNPRKKTKIESDNLFYEFYVDRYIHLGVSKYPSNDYYFPRTFLEDKKDSWIEGSTPLQIKAVEVINHNEQIIVPPV